MVRIFGNAVGWPANAAKLSSVGLWLNASKSESMLECDDIHLDWCFSTNSLWSTRYFKELSNVGRVKSSVDDLNGTWYCKHESSLCATICWGSASVPRFVRWHVSWSVVISCLPVVALSPPPTLHLAAQNKQTTPTPCLQSIKHKAGTATTEPHFESPGDEKRSTYLCGYVLNWLPENNIRVTTPHNNQSTQSICSINSITKCKTLEGNRGQFRLAFFWKSACGACLTDGRPFPPNETLQKIFTIFLFPALLFTFPHATKSKPQKPIQTHNNTTTFHHHLILFFTPPRLPACHALTHFPAISLTFPSARNLHSTNISTRACAADKQYTHVRLKHPNGRTFYAHRIHIFFPMHTLHANLNIPNGRPLQTTSPSQKSLIFSSYSLLPYTTPFIKHQTSTKIQYTSLQNIKILNKKVTSLLNGWILKITKSPNNTSNFLITNSFPTFWLMFNKKTDAMESYLSTPRWLCSSLILKKHTSRDSHDIKGH